MRSMVTCGFALIILGASGCVSPKETVPSLPPSVGNGIGSQYGNYAAQEAGEMRDASGNRCVLFNWDRPLNKDLAVRYTSASCESPEHPGWMSPLEISRTVIPISQSNLRDERDEAGQ
jgi:hypothetical protein